MSQVILLSISASGLSLFFCNLLVLLRVQVHCSLFSSFTHVPSYKINHYCRVVAQCMAEFVREPHKLPGQVDLSDTDMLTLIQLPSSYRRWISNLGAGWLISTWAFCLKAFPRSCFLRQLSELFIEPCTSPQDTSAKHWRKLYFTISTPSCLRLMWNTLCWPSSLCLLNDLYFTDFREGIK